MKSSGMDKMKNLIKFVVVQQRLKLIMSTSEKKKLMKSKDKKKEVKEEELKEKGKEKEKEEEEDEDEEKDWNNMNTTEKISYSLNFPFHWVRKITMPVINIFF